MQLVLYECSFTAAEPRHVECWIPIAKAVENAGLPIEAVLKKVVVNQLGKEESAGWSCMSVQLLIL